MRILMLTQWFDPEPATKGLSFARALQRRGHDVEVLTGFPNYPGGKLYPGYRVRGLQREVSDGVLVTRVPLYPSHDASGVRRTLNYLSFAASACLIGMPATRRPDLIYVYHPPLTADLAAVVTATVKRVPFVCDIQDLWPDTLRATGMLRSRRGLQAVDAGCRVVYRRAAHLVVQSEGFRRALVGRGVPDGKLSVIHNWCDEDLLHIEDDPKVRHELDAGHRFNVVFAGTMGKAQGLDCVIEAAALLQHSVPRAQLVLVGDGVEHDRLQRLAIEKDLHNVRFLPRRPMAEIGGVLAAADVLLVHLKDDPLFRLTVPSKTQAYLAAGKPILMAVRGDAADLIERSGSGVVCEPEDAASLAGAIADLSRLPASALRTMGQRGKDLYLSEMSLEAGTTKFEGVFEAAVGGRVRPSVVA